LLALLARIAVAVVGVVGVRVVGRRRVVVVGGLPERHELGEGLLGLAPHRAAHEGLPDGTGQHPAVDPGAAGRLDRGVVVGAHPDGGGVGRRVADGPGVVVLAGDPGALGGTGLGGDGPAVGQPDPGGAGDVEHGLGDVAGHLRVDALLAGVGALVVEHAPVGGL